MLGTHPLATLALATTEGGITVVLVTRTTWLDAYPLTVRRLRPFDPALFAQVVVADEPPLRRFLPAIALLPDQGARALLRRVAEFFTLAEDPPLQLRRVQRLLEAIAAGKRTPFSPALFEVVVVTDDPPLRLAAVRRILEEAAGRRRAPFAPAIFEVVVQADAPPLRLPPRAVVVTEMGVPPGARWLVLPIEGGPSELPEQLFWRARRAFEAVVQASRGWRPGLAAFATPPTTDDPPLAFRWKAGRVPEDQAKRGWTANQTVFATPPAVDDPPLSLPRVRRPEPEPRRTIWLAPWVPIEFAPPPVTDDPPFAARAIRRFEPEPPKPIRRWPADWVVLFEPEPVVPPVVNPTEPPGGGGGKRRRRPVEHVVHLERERPRGRPVEPEPAIATPADVAGTAVIEAAPAPAEFAFEVPAGAAFVSIPGALPTPSAEGVVLAGAAALEAAVVDDERLRLLLFAAVTLS